MEKISKDSRDKKAVVVKTNEKVLSLRLKEKDKRLSTK